MTWRRSGASWVFGATPVVASASSCIEFGALIDGREHLPPMPQRNADVFQILIGQMAEYRNINFVVDKAFRVLGHAELFEPVRNLLHRGPRAA